MSGKRALLSLSLAAAISLALSWAIQASFAQESSTTPEDANLGVEWDFRPASLDQLVEETPAIVVAEVQAVRSGEPLVAQPADGAGEPFTAPTERIDLRVTEAIDGQTPSDFTLFQLGEENNHPEGDPGYRIGERYLLFVRPRLNDAGTAPNSDDTWLSVAPDGRLERLSSGRLNAQIEGPVAEELDGSTLRQAEQAIDEAGAGS